VNLLHWLAQAQRADAATYAAVARIDIPALDRAMRQLSRTANYSKPWIGGAAVLAVAGGDKGRRAAVDGLAAIAVTAAVANAAIKPLGRRRRPVREGALPRHVRMPRSRSFPSGHTAAGFAFASGVGATLPELALPLRTLAGLVGYSRVHTGVHYPGDVVSGALLGVLLARLTTTWAGKRRRS
jgi:membrane-associated phospholipid phosphatase